MAYSNPVRYYFVTKWQIKAPIEKVWDVIEKGEDWPSWWKGVEKAEILYAGNPDDIGKIIHYSVKSFLPFMLSFDYTITVKEKCKKIIGDASGDLEGTGVWTFEESNGITHVQYIWDVISTKKIINLLSPALKWFFSYNHNLVMHWGAKRLANKLLVSSQILSSRAIHFDLAVDPTKEINELSMFADNLGSIPPNTALMIVDDGKKRFEIRISSSLEKNATVRIKRKKS